MKLGLFFSFQCLSSAFWVGNGHFSPEPAVCKTELNIYKYIKNIYIYKFIFVYKQNKTTQSTYDINFLEHYRQSYIKITFKFPIS